MPVADATVPESDVKLRIHTPGPALHHISVVGNQRPMTGPGLADAPLIAVMIEQVLRLLRRKFFQEELVCHVSSAKTDSDIRRGCGDRDRLAGPKSNIEDLTANSAGKTRDRADLGAAGSRVVVDRDGARGGRSIDADAVQIATRGLERHCPGGGEILIGPTLWLLRRCGRCSER
jgi:hypothetical protein